MKKMIAAVIILVFLFAAGIALAEDRAANSTCMKGDSPFECAAKCIKCWGKCFEKSAAVETPAPVITDEELKTRRECVGMGMRGRTK